MFDDSCYKKKHDDMKERILFYCDQSDGVDNMVDLSTIYVLMAVKSQLARIPGGSVVKVSILGKCNMLSMIWRSWVQTLVEANLGCVVLLQQVTFEQETPNEWFSTPYQSIQGAKLPIMQCPRATVANVYFLCSLLKTWFNP